MKNKLLLCIVFLLGVNLFSQNLNDRIFIVNPKKDRSLLILDETMEIESTQNLLDNNRLIIRFGIYDNSENLVFFRDTNNFMDPFNSSFSEFRVNMPAFEWRGEYDNEYGQIRRITGTTVPDGEYTLRIYIQTEKTEGKGGEIISQTAYRVIVDTTPPEFELELIIVPHLGEIQNGDLGKYYIYPKGEKADRWKFEIQGKESGKVYYSETHAEEFIMLEFVPKDEDCIVTVHAVDEAQNESTRILELQAQLYTRFDSNKKQQAVIDELQKTIAELQVQIDELQKTIAELRERENKSDDTIQSLKLSDIRRMAGELYPYLDVPDIVFPGNKANVISLQDLIENIIRINNVVNMVMPFIDEFSYLHIHGFGNPLNYYAGAKARDTEEKEELKLLSLQRAEYVKNIMVLMGIPEEKIKVSGMGGTVIRADPLNDKENWQNRIVRFYIE